MRTMARGLAVAIFAIFAASAVVPEMSPAGDGAMAATKAERKAARQRREAERLRQRPAKAEPAAAKPAVAPVAPVVVAPVAPPPPPLPPERVEADVSTRSIAVTSAFRGSEIVVFGSVDNSRQPSAEAGYYDVIVIVEGRPTKLTVRRKSNVGGLWINTAAAQFRDVPSYYAIASTRPVEEIASAEFLREHEIGFGNIGFEADAKSLSGMLASELTEYRLAAAHLKEDEGLFTREDTGVAFIGRSLFRSSIELPANIPVGELGARVYLLRDGELLSQFRTRVGLERKGLELFLYDFAHEKSLLYGILAVALAVLSGFAASSIFRRQQS